MFQPIDLSWSVANQQLDYEPEVNAMVYKMNTMQEGDGVIDKVLRGEALYAVGTLRMAVYLRKDPSLYIVMLDNGAEINIMHVGLAEKLGLTITELNYRQMTSTNQSKSKFLGIAENTLVITGSFCFSILFFMIEGQVSHNCVLE